MLNQREIYHQLFREHPDLATTPAGLAFAAFTYATELMVEQRFHAALDYLDRGLALLPSDKFAKWRCAMHYHQAICYLSLGDYERGFGLVEFRRPFLPHPGDEIDLPMWRGENLRGKRILIYQEYGFGDVIMLLRFIPLVQQRGAKITLMIDRALHRLAHTVAPNIRMVGNLVTRTGFDYKCPMFGLVSALGIDKADFPLPPYLVPAREVPSGEAYNKELFGSRPRQSDSGQALLAGPTKIGIAWSGNPKFTNDVNRSIDLPLFWALLEHEGCELHALQIGNLDVAREFDVKIPIIKDFADTADLIMQMDHIVSVDSAPVHVAGAIGHPSVHLLLPFAPEWRWFSAPVWYPEINLYRQPRPGDWFSVFDQINGDLAKRVEVSLPRLPWSHAPESNTSSQF